MGEPKAAMDVGGTAAAERAAAPLTAAGAGRVVLVGARSADVDRLGIDGVPDRWPGEGPLGGIATALLDVLGPGDQPALITVVIACDQPDVTAPLIERLVDALADAPTETMAAAVRTPDGRRHPFPSAWRTSWGPQVGALVDSGQRRADAGFSLGEVALVDAPHDELADLDTPDDLARWRPNG